MIVGNLSDDKWIGALIRHVKQLDPSLQIDFFGDSYQVKSSPAMQLCEHVYKTKRHYPAFLYKIPRIRVRFSELDIKRSFDEFLTKKIADKFRYDIVNFQYLNNETLCNWEKVQCIADKTLLMPWGSDVLRRSKSEITRMTEYCQHYDYIAATDNPRFQREIKKRLQIKESQFQPLELGVTAIDLLNQHSYITREEAKKKFGFGDAYVITCGYNSSPGQNHLKIIDAIAKIKEQIPQDILLVFPMTYGEREQVHEVKNHLSLTGLSGKIFDKYLSDEEVVYLRNCSDMFIHAQKTDSNSASLAEYLLCKSTVINASWIKYEHYEKYGRPYYSFDDFDQLPEIIIKAYKGGTLVTEEIAGFIKHYGWAYKAKRWVDIFNGNFK